MILASKEAHKVLWASLAKHHVITPILPRNTELDHPVRAGKEIGVHIQLVVEVLLVELHLRHLHHRVREAVVEQARLDLQQLLTLLLQLLTHLRIVPRITEQF